MRYLVWFPVLIWAGAACDSGPGVDNNNNKVPTGFTFETADGTIQSSGYPGAFHGIKGAPKTSFGVKNTSCDANVGQFVGPIAPDPQVDPTQHQRCLYQTSKTCNADADCPPPTVGTGPAQCVYLYDPPLATPISSRTPAGVSVVGACALTYIPLKEIG